MMRFGYAVVFLVMIMACQDNGEEGELDPVRLGYEFFPLQVGAYIIYDVEEITYSSERSITTNYQLRTQVVDSFMNQAGSLTYVLHELRRDSPDDAWEFIQTNSLQRNETQGVFFDGNVPFLRLSFPVVAGKTWDGNALNAEPEDLYEMDSVFSAYITPSGQNIPETLTVIQEDNDDFTVNLIRRFEIYGQDIGLVYKEEIDLRYCTEQECIGQQIIESGQELRQSLLEYGQE